MTSERPVAPEPDDADARSRILNDLDRTYFVEAAAETGKTTALVGRMVNMLASGRVTMERLAAITFTEAAAAELRDRVRALLLGISQDTLRTVAALLEDRHDLLAPDTVWEAVEPPPGLYVAQFVGRRLTQLERSVPYALDGEGDPLIQTVLSAQSNARQLLAAHTDDDALSALVGLGFGFGFGKLRADMVSSERWRRSSDSAADGARSLRAASYRDICILLPARTHFAGWSGRSSEWVCHTQSKPASVLATQEVRDLLACLRAIEDSSDQVALVAALRSPAYACSDVDLLHWVENGGRLDHERPGDGPDGLVRDALASLAEYHQVRSLRSPAALIEAFIADRMLVASAFGEPRPREAWRRLRYVVSRARAFTGTGRHTLRAFLDWIEGLQHAEVRDPESSMPSPTRTPSTFRRSTAPKGLEYPIVLLGGLGSPRARTLHVRRTHRRSEHWPARLPRGGRLADQRLRHGTVA